MTRIISHIFLSALLIVTVSGMTINLHYCGDHLYDMAINTAAHSCCDFNEEDTACHHDHDKGKMDHCNDKTIDISKTNDFVISGFSFDFENYHFSELFLITPVTIENSLTDSAPVRKIISDRKPPPQEVVLSQIQSYLI